ncbi:MAG: methyltransferase domain-containing protein [Pseudomonadales bacterium]|nr:methyltransferase domain-containing protein [Pseudomonadales bacterium]MDA0761388.1 methyltransferase domain-containing protein [Pseudomonadota bacterium]MDA0958945.1 methyltransferase domain-containing protein [Pseudomonadota bacterium]
MKYRCPVCQKHALVKETGGFSCDAGHRFDRSRYGYVNLLLAHQRRSKNPGDAAAMLAARRTFLSTGHYAPLAQALAGAIATDWLPSACLLDVGCGEGYYLSALERADVGIKADQLWGIDIAKAAVQMAAQRDTARSLAVAAARVLPFFDNSFDVVLSVFSPFDLDEVERVLKPSGQFVVVGPGPQHLQELKAMIYAEVQPHAANFAKLEAMRVWKMASQRQILSEAFLQDDALAALFQMTPYYWRATAQQQDDIESVRQAVVTLDFDLRTYRLGDLP